MYPETDIPPIPLSPDLLRKLAGSLPEHPTAARERFRNTYRLSAESMSALHQADALDLFEALVAHGNPASLVVRLLTQDLPAAEAEVGAAFEAVGEPELLDLLESVRSGVCSKEAMAPVLVALGRGAPDVAHALQRAGIAAMTPEQLNVIIARILEANTALIQSRGREALSALMGDVMREVRGRRDGKEVAERLQQALAQRLRGEGR